MPSKKSNKGKKTERVDSNSRKNASDEAFEKLLQDESLQSITSNETPKKSFLKCSSWTQDPNWLDVTLFVGQKIKAEDVRDIKYTDQTCDLQLSDGREWSMHFFKPIEMSECRIQLKGIRIHLRVKKKVPGNWLDMQFVPGQSERLSPAKKRETENRAGPATHAQNTSTNAQTTSTSAQPTHVNGALGTHAGDGKQGSSKSSVTSEQNTEKQESAMDTHEMEQTVAPPGEEKPDLSDLVEDDGNQMELEKQDAEKPQDDSVYSLMHVKNDYYEKGVVKPNDTVSVQMFVKQIIPESLNVSFKGCQVSVRFRTRNAGFLKMYEGTSEDTVFCWAVEVVAELLESQCKYKLTQNSLELTLRKVKAERWCALEAVHTKGKAHTSTDWISASDTKTTAAVAPNNATVAQTTSNKCVFDELENQENVGVQSSARQGGVLSDRGAIQKPTCMVSPLQPPREKQVVTPGYTGLDNLGNTCFMNSVLQVLANTTELKHYFLEKHFEAEINLDNPLGSQGKLACEFAQLIQKLWSGTKFSYAPTNLKKLVAQKKSMFSGFAQHDAQEYMSYLLDGLHEDVNRVKKKPYIEQLDSNGRPDQEVADESWENHKKRNNSFLVDLFQGQFKSKLVCPVCQKVSVTFDPFMHLPVPLPKKQRVLPVLFMSQDARRKPLQLLVKLPKHATVETLKDAVAQRTGVAAKNLRVFEAYHNKVHCVFERRAPLSHVTSSDTIIVHEVMGAEVAGEPVTEVIVIQRLMVPPNKPGRCSCCHKDSKVGTSLLRCTGCYRVGYCDISCQKEHWQRHRLDCRSQPANVGTPFLVSLPQSQLTYARLSQLADMYSRYSVNVFQPPQSEEPAPSPPSPSPTECPPVETQTDTDQATQSQSTPSDPSLSSSDTTDSGHGTTESDSRADANPDTNGDSQAMSSSVSSQDTELWSVGENSGKESMSVSTSSTSLSTDLDSENESERPARQTRVVLARPQEPEAPAPQFYLKPCDKDGVSGRGIKRLEDRGDEPLPLEGVQYLAMEWKNSEKVRPCVQVETKELVHTVDPSVNSMLSEENKDLTLHQCLSLFTEPEVLSADEAWYCPGCKQHREASKQMSLWRLPNILIIQLKRFSYRNLLWCDKVDKMVDFPTQGLDLSDYASTEAGGSVYDLYGVVNHYGGILGGHYTSFTRCVSREKGRNDLGWRLCDDSHVTKSSEKQVVTPAAYVLFYRRRGMHLPLPSPPPSPTQTDKQTDTQTDEPRPVFTISPDPPHTTRDTSSLFTDTFCPRPRPRSFSFSEGETRSHDQGGGDSLLENKYREFFQQQQPGACTDMDSVD